MIKPFLFQPRFIWKVRPLACVLGVVGAFCMASATYKGLWDSPPDAYQGEWVRLMYIHVPCSWMALLLYGALGITSGLFLIYKLPTARWVAYGCGKVGLMFGVLSVITGMIWAKPTWGAWWVWDARLTSMTLLVLLYIGFVMLERRTMTLQSQSTGSMLGVLGLINLPIIKGSVTWWATLHQPPSVTWHAQATIDPLFMVPLGMMTVGMMSLSFFIVYSLTLSQLALHQRKTQEWRHVLQRTPQGAPPS